MSASLLSFTLASSAQAGFFDQVNRALDTVERVNDTIDRGESAARRTQNQLPNQQSQQPTGTQQFPGSIFQPANQAQGGQMEYNIDRRGDDYRNFELNQADARLCQSACNSESRCKAWTYVNPGIQSSRAMCWLKDRVPQAQSNSCCTSGIKTTNSGYKTSAYGASKNVSGLWSTSWYDMNLKQKQGESAVSGTYDFSSGRIYGTMNGNTLTGYWTSTGSARECNTTKYGSRHWGRVKFTFISDNEFKGMYQYCEYEPTSDYKWDGKRK